ncbi:MAG: S46 family peptidase [Planctomycetota bacterium]
MRSIAFLLALSAFPAPTLLAQDHAELGRMWTFENLPLAWFKEAYDFQPSTEWLEKVRLSALRFGNGCSASFVSPRGLIMTNHHCARAYVAQVSPKDQDWLGDGFFSKSVEDEVQIPDLKVRQLVHMRDVTADMNDGVAELEDATERQAKLAENRKRVEAAAKEKTPDLEHQLITLYQGGMYQLYSYKVYSDIRLVGTPHLQCAKFGGDPDNFTYPRFGLDFAFVRAWENGRPADTSKHYYKWRTAGPDENETVFVVGNPGSTGRLKSIAQMEYLRDEQYPAVVASLEQRLKQMYEMANRSEEQGKALRAQILSVENSRKAVQGYLDGLRDERVMAVKRKAEQAAREALKANAELSQRLGDPWVELEELCAKKRQDPRAARGRELRAEEDALEKRIGEAFFALYGTTISPDATFSLRLADGVVKPFPSNGTIAPWFTSLYGLYARHTEFGGKPPFDLPQAWLDREKALDLKTPFNLVSTCDIIGGNSGSPMIDKEARIVGLIFDGNIEMLANNYVFTDEVARSVSVHPAIIVAALRKVYDVPQLADEIEGSRGRVPVETRNKQPAQIR